MEYISLNKICDVRDGTHDSPQYVLSGYPLVTSKNIVDGKLDLSTVNYISQEDYDKINARSKVDVGDVIMPMIGTIGNPFLVNEDPNYAIKNVALIKFPNKNICNRFIWYFLKSVAFKKYVSEKNKGGTQKFLSLGDIRNMDVPLVSLDNQLKIVEKLDYISQIIDKRILELNALDRLIKARFVELFGDPKINEKNWNTGIVSQFYEVKGGKRIPKGMGYADGITAHPYLRATDMKNETILDDDIHYIDEAVFEKIKRYTVKGGDIYLTNVGVNLGMAGVIPDKFDGANLTENAVKLVPKTDEVLNGLFLAHYINSPGIQDYINERKMSVGVPKLAIFRIETMPLILPPMNLQIEFIDFCNQVDKSKTVVQKSLYEARLLFDKLMQLYFGRNE